MSTTKKGQKVPKNAPALAEKEVARPKIATEGIISKTAERRLKKRTAALKQLESEAVQKIISKEIKEIKKSRKKRLKNEGWKTIKVKKAKQEVELNEMDIEVMVPQKRSRYKKLSKSQKLSNKYRRQLRKQFGEKFVITDEEMRIYKRGKKNLFSINNSVEAILFFSTVDQLPNNSFKKMIILAITVWTIKAKLAMPNKKLAFKQRSIDMAQVQTLNVSGYFTVAFTGLALWITRNSALDLAIQKQELGTGTAAAYITARRNVKLSLNLFLIYLNGLALADQVHAEDMITIALCEVTKVPTTNKQDFGIRQGIASGSIVLTALKAVIDGKKVSAIYYWQYGLMVDGNLVWTDLPETDTSKTIATGMGLGVTTYFRMRYKTKKGGMTDWFGPLDISPK